MAYPFHVLNSLNTFIKEVTESQMTLMTKAFESVYTNNNELLRHCITIMILVCVATFVCKLVCFSKCLKKDKQAVFFALFEDKIRPAFPQQSKETHFVVYDGIMSILKCNPEKPVVLLFLVPYGNVQTAMDYAQHLGYCVSKTLMRRSCSEAMSEVILEGSDYASFDDYWAFHSDMSERISSHGIVIVHDFQRIHPYVTTVLCHLADDTYSPFPKAAILLIADTGDRFNYKEAEKLTPMLMAEIFLEEQFGSMLSSNALVQLVSTTTGRTVFIQSEKPQLTEISSERCKPIQVATSNVNEFDVNEEYIGTPAADKEQEDAPIIDKDYISSLLDKQYVSKEEPVRDVDVNNLIRTLSDL